MPFYTRHCCRRIFLQGGRPRGRSVMRRVLSSHGRRCISARSTQMRRQRIGCVCVRHALRLLCLRNMHRGLSFRPWSAVPAMRG